MSGFLKKLFGQKKNASSEDTVVLAEPELTIARANNELQLRTQAAVDMWGLDIASWNVDLDAGTITFVNDDKGLVITAPVQVIGTYDTEEGSWLWGWDHPSASEALGEAARQVRRFGEQYGLENLTSRKVFASMDETWAFTALACHLSKSEGGYSGLSGTTRVLMVYGQVTISEKV